MENSGKVQNNEVTLPAPLFFLQQGQIWLLTQDGKQAVQITKEAEPVTEFSVSMISDRLVFISGNQLAFSKKDGGDRKIIRHGQLLVISQDPLEMMNDQANIRTTIRSPLISNDGSKVVFVENGLWLMNIDDEQIELIWGNSSDNQNIIYRLLAWSPDENSYLVSKYAYPIQSINQLTIGLVNKGLVVTMPNATADGFAWYAGGQGLILSSSKAGHPGSLMRCEMEEFRCVEIAEFEPARWYYFYSFPKVVNDASINVFMAAVSNPMLVPDSYKIIRVNLDGYNRQELISGEFPVEKGLWAEDGNGVVIQLSKSFHAYPAGAVLWVDLAQKKIHELPMSNISQMMWAGSYE